MIGWVIDAALASALLMAMVLLLRGPVRRLFGPTVAYGLWALPAARLMLPPIPAEIPAEWIAPSAPITRMGELVLAVTPALDTVPVGPTASWQAVVPLMWIAGAVGFLMWHALRYAGFRANILHDHELLTIVGRVVVVASEAAPGPIAFGVLSPRIAVPTDFHSRYDADERSLALAHELGHHARGDLLANWIALAVLAIHWWNPLAWIAHRAFRADQEMANDARVLAGRDPAAVHAYARAIVKAVGGSGHTVACHLHSIADLKGRIRMLKAAPASPRRVRMGIAAVALTATATLALTASGGRAAAVTRDSIGETVGVDLASAEIDWTALRLPAPPVPPVALAHPGLVLAQALPATPPAVSIIPPVPPMPPLPATSPVPPVPPMPPVPPVPPIPNIYGDRQVTIVRTRKGQAARRIVHTGHGRELDLAAIPEVREASCGRGDRALVRHETQGGKRVTIICTDRIEQVADHASRAIIDAGQIERDALESALSGLRGARAAVDANPQLSGEQKRRARGGIEQGIREIEDGLSKSD
ncbi:M56 family metallopeptidase [uncultured Sphingomonas sp.]|uniref:M56 family metallopeptidase n=1 Tax=uncultured Sphingomonas sp. TaxID=158754 RepID=UPI0035CBA135